MGYTQKHQFRFASRQQGLLFQNVSFLLYFLMIRQTCSYKFGLWFQYSSLVQTSQADLQKIMLCLKIFSISDKRMP